MNTNSENMWKALTRSCQSIQKWEPWLNKRGINNRLVDQSDSVSFLDKKHKKAIVIEYRADDSHPVSVWVCTFGDTPNTIINQLVLIYSDHKRAKALFPKLVKRWSTSSISLKAMESIIQKEMVRMKNNLATRQLPENVIHEDMLQSYEPNEMAKKFSSPHYIIKHADWDQIAFSYMNLEAKLYWLPKFMSFIQTAKHDGYIDQHIETLVYCFSDRQWVNRAKEKMFQFEEDAVAGFLAWIHEKHPECVDPHVTYACYLWKKF